MKRVVFITILCLLISLQSCKDFLNLTPRNTKVVSTIEDYRDIMASYLSIITEVNPEQRKVFGGMFLYPAFGAMAEYLSYYTGERLLDKSLQNVWYDNEGNLNERGRSVLSWSLYEGTSGQIWDANYAFTGPLNLVINEIDNADGADELLRRRVKGEALVWRSYAYFKLLQLYCPYDDDRYGLPLCLDPVTDISNVMPPRSTQNQTYKQIIDDCLQALELLDVSPSTPWNVAYKYGFVNSMLASIYHYKAMSVAAEPTDWSNAEMYATQAITGRNLAVNAQAEIVLKNMFNCDVNDGGVVKYEADECFVRIIDGDHNQLISLPFYSSMIEPNTINLYMEGDARKARFFKDDRFVKYGSMTKSAGVYMPFRLAEAYLIKAEAQLRNNDIQSAQQTLEEFRRSRYANLPVTPNDPFKLLEEILLERQREFVCEIDIRWLDMKRLGVEVSRDIDGENYQLIANDFRYTLPIPKRELEYNRNIIQNPGWEGYVPK